jgi:hypothetical protein
MNTSTTGPAASGWASEVRDASVFTALARKVRRFHVEEEERVHNILRGFSKLFATVEHVLLASAYEPIAADHNTPPTLFGSGFRCARRRGEDVNDREQQSSRCCRADR